MPGPLTGFRVLDLSQWQQGPYATVVLSDMGADVIKVERPAYGDAGRHGMGGWDDEGLTPDFFAHNRGKRGITIDLSTPRGRDLILQLAERADVVVHNYRAGVMEQWGLTYEAFREWNARIIYARAGGNGPDGPDHDAPMFDIVAQARAGIMSVTGEAGCAPLPAGVFQADQTGGMMLALAILGALLARERTGTGQQLDVSLLGTQVALQSYELTHHLFTGETPPRAGRGHPQTDPLWGTFRASDGWFVIAGVREDRLADFAALICDPDLFEDERFTTRRQRLAHRAEFVQRVDAAFGRERVDHWLQALRALGIACGPVQTYDEVVRDPQVRACGYIGEIEYPGRGQVPVVNTPIAYSETPAAPQGPPPELSQHTEQVLLELGYDWPEILALRDDGVI